MGSTACYRSGMRLQEGFIGLPVLVAILLGLVVVGGGAYFVMQQSTSSQTGSENFDTVQTLPTTNIEPQTQPTTNTPAQTQTSVPNTTLVIFSDSRVSYTFKYPNKYRADVFDYGTNSNEVCIVGASVKNPQGCWMQFRTGITSELFSEQKVIDEALSVNVVYEQEAVREGEFVPAIRRHVTNTTVGNIAAKGIVSTARDGKQNLINVVVDRGSLTYVFSSGAVIGSPEHKEFLDIMNSVSFVAQQGQTSSEDPFKVGFKTGETNFLAKTESINGILMVVFGAQITRTDGGNYEAFILFGDGDEESVAHWSPTLFNEEMNHEYRQSGNYTASLVLVPKTLLTEEVLQRRKKIQELVGTTVIKTIHVAVEASGKITVQN